MTNAAPTTLAAPPAPREIIEVEPDATGIKCDGGNGALGHPAVYYAFDGKPAIACWYCSRIFVKK